MLIQVSIVPSCFVNLGSRGKSEVCFIVYYPMEMSYSLVDGENIVTPENPAVKDTVTLKDGKGDTFQGKVVFIGKYMSDYEVSHTS